MPVHAVSPPPVPLHFEGVQPNPPTASSAHTRSEPEPSFRQVFQQLAQSVDQGEHTVTSALRVPADAGKDRQMLALQAGVYRYVEAIDLCSRLVDRATNAVKTTLQSQ